MTLTDLCEKLRNWFDVDRHFGTFEIVNGTIDLDFIREGQFVRLIGSGIDGVYAITNEKKLFFITGIGSNDEFSGITSHDNITFKGAVWELNFSINFIMKYKEICKWEEKNAKVLNSPFQSESFGGYSYSKANGSNGSLTVWDNFASDLARWQKI